MLIKMKESKISNQILTIPNLLSFFRILLVPVFVLFYFSDMQNHYIYAVLTLILSGLTDVADGIIARKYNMISNFGKIIDPFADKLTQGVAVVCLAINHPILIPLLILFFAKEFTMLLGACHLFKMGKRPSEAKWWGKLSTVILYLMLCLVLLSDIFPHEIIWGPVITTLMVITSICIVFSLFSYYPIFKEIQTGEYDIEKETKAAKMNRTDIH